VHVCIAIAQLKCFFGCLRCVKLRSRPRRCSRAERSIQREARTGDELMQIFLCHAGAIDVPEGVRTRVGEGLLLYTVTVTVVTD
jgi:ligand-binding sensor protein